MSLIRLHNDIHTNVRSDAKNDGITGFNRGTLEDSLRASIGKKGTLPLVANLADEADANKHGIRDGVWQMARQIEGGFMGPFAKCDNTGIGIAKLQGRNCLVVWGQQTGRTGFANVEMAALIDPKVGSQGVELLRYTVDCRTGEVHFRTADA